MLSTRADLAVRGTIRKQTRCAHGTAVERIIRSVLTDLAAPFTPVDVERTALGWHAMMKQMARKRVISVRLPDGPTPAIQTTELKESIRTAP